MFFHLREFFRRHPAVCDAIRWSIPAILFGAVLRALLLSYLPYAHWGSDSRSYYSFAHQLLTEGYISLGAKRRFLYPILMVPVSLLPGAPLQWVAWLQHALGLASIVPLAYVLRKTIVHWRLAVVPITLLFTGLPIFLWYEHELLGEAVFFYALVWAFAGWVAWANAGSRERAARLFWCFFIPIAAFLITKPSGRFVVPALALGLVIAGLWRTLQRRHVIACVALFLTMLGVGSKEQGAWLLYVSTFPLTQLDTPKHAEHKAQIRDLVEPLRREIDVYYEQDDEPFSFLEAPDRLPDRPLWNKLAKDPKKKSALYMDLAKEGVLAEPLLFLYLGAQRLVVSANMSSFKETKFDSDIELERFADDYRRAQAEEAKGRHSQLHRVLGFGKGERLPPWAEFQRRMQPGKDLWAERFFFRYVRDYEHAFDLTRLPQGEVTERSIRRAQVLLPGWWLLAALPLALLPRYRSTLGVWMLVAVSYLSGVFLVSQMNPRYFAPAWPLLLVLLAVPLDVAVRLIRRGKA
jgi:hypothetical protein